MSRRATRKGSRGAIAIAAALVVLLSPKGGAQESLTVGDVVTRLGDYLADYATRLPATIASEHYVQLASAGIQRQVTLDSDFGIVRLPGVSQWLGFRDVLQKDGKPVADHQRRLEMLFLNAPGERLEQAQLIAEESARHNIGQVARNINNPALVLELLDARNAPRMRFTKGGEDVVEKVKTWVVRFQEVGRPTIIRTPGESDVPTVGRAWVEPATGTLVRAEFTVASRVPPNSFTGTTELTFRLDTKLGFWVPATMNEQYFNSRLALVSSGQAVYGTYRQFAVDTNESLSPRP